MAKRILIVDDEPDLVEMLRNRLEANGYEVITAYDGQEGLEKAKSQKPDLIILDLTLPKLNGHEVSRLLQADDNYKHIPIVMLTARKGIDDIKAGLDLGSAAYIAKPFEPNTLLGIIKGILGG